VTAPLLSTLAKCEQVCDFEGENGMATQDFEFPFVGPQGEPIDFARTISGHGVTSLAPMEVDEIDQSLTVTLALPDSLPPRTLTIRSRAPGTCTAEIHGRAAAAGEIELLAHAARWILRLDQDLSGFYALAAADGEFAWVARGAGRMTRCQTVFEDVVKTICTTNCAWSATIRMTNALVERLGEPAPDAPAGGWHGRAFPTPEAMAAADDDFYRSFARCGYRGAYLKSLAQSIVDGELDLESLGSATAEELSDDELATKLLALPGVGPYAAAHIMMMLGRNSRLVLDSFTRPTYAKIVGPNRFPIKRSSPAFRHMASMRGSRSGSL
jgi:3-methyladenine DNA glycosylase/8-oxoguanine DNA glycosylase